jgi:hypothetical protein
VKHRYALPALLLLALAFAAPALAARPVPAPVPLQGTRLQHLGALRAPADTYCWLGVWGEGAWAVDFLAPPGDAYYTLLDPATCSCSAAGVFLGNAHVDLYFPTTACTLPLTISIVAADVTDPACPVPLPDQVICEPVSYVPAPTSPGLWDFCMGLAVPCCVNTKVFLKVEFDGVGTCTDLPLLVTTDGCQPCLSWNGYEGALVDLCNAGLPGNPVMYVQALCCDVVPTRGGTWGRLKTLYR